MLIGEPTDRLAGGVGDPSGSRAKRVVDLYHSEIR
jgi:hypothetical protein